MPSVWGDALMALGSSLPKVGQSIDTYQQNKMLRDWQRQEMERRARKDEKDIEMKNLQLGEMRNTIQEREKAEKSFYDYVEDARLAKNIPQIMEAGPSQQHDRLVRAEKTQNMAPTERLKEYGLLSGAAYSPKVQTEVETVLGSEAEKRKAKNDLALSNLGYKQDVAMKKLESQLRSDEERKKEAAKLDLEREKLSSKKKKNATIDPDKLEFKNALINQLETVMNHPAKYSGISPGRVTSIFPTESRDFKQQIQKLKSMTTLENLKYLKGAMSDKDVKFIQEASTALDLGGSMKALDRELEKMYKSATSSSSIPQATSKQTSIQSTGTPTPQTQDEYDSLPSGTIYIDPDDGKRYRKP